MATWSNLLRSSRELRPDETRHRPIAEQMRLHAVWIGLIIAAAAYYPRFASSGDVELYPLAAQCLLASLPFQTCAMPFTYPPAFAFVMIPFAPLPPGLRTLLWYVVTVGGSVLVYACCERLARRLFPGPWTARQLAWLRAAKEEGLPITIGVCPHHLWLTQDDLPMLGAFGIMKPGLKTARDRDALWEALQNGLVDVVESDHAPHTLAEKASERPPYGVPGLETTLPLLLSAVHERRLTLERVIDLVANNPRRIWRLDAPPETYALVDLHDEYVIDRAHLHSACGWSPFEGLRVRGRVIETWIRGAQVYDGERVLAQPGFGRNLFA